MSMTLQEAVDALPENLDELIEMFPEAKGCNPWFCPVALFLQKKTEAKVSVSPTTARHAASIDFVWLPERVAQWIDSYDNKYS